MKMKRTISLLLVLVMCLAVLPMGAAASSGWVKEDGDWYYYDADDTPHDGWLKYNGKWYYCYSGYMATGSNYIDGKEYYFGDDGVMVTGWIKLYDSWYYYDDSGAAHEGWLQYNGKWYYFHNGCMTTGIEYINDIEYYFKEDGSMAVGWTLMTSFNVWNYYDSDGRPYNGWLKDGGKWYYFVDGWATTGVEAINGVGSIFDSDGVWQGYASAGWVYDSIWSCWYYFGAGGKAYTGWLKQGGNYYYLRNSYMYTGVYVINGAGHIFGANGVWKGYATAGWVYDSVWDDWYYFGDGGTEYNGWLKDGGKWYYLENSMMVRDTFLDLDDVTYYLDKSGAMATGWTKTYWDSWYYFHSDGTPYDGWLDDGGKWYYIDNGWMVSGMDWYVDGVVYTFDSSGVWTGESYTY